ncbi:hypothetical protein AJ78_08044 [Emergomyces pasteurianus Ep9510]|uniref:Uncharacterized protein n=1 Tax=Emergomyces pasteurianus Ep9510 TaxID=1447872 RepID=A0A1J9P424_9EURO|nr:hypothetical protein AJ78_08044 [Emergomyces pasteurianus Ep9510]
MSQPVPSTDANRAAPMRARRGGISLGGRRKLSQSQLFRQPGTLHFASRPHHSDYRETTSMNTHNTAAVTTSLVVPGRLTGDLTNQLNAGVSRSEPSRQLSPEPDLDDDSLDERAQSLLHQFLCTSSTGSLNKTDSVKSSKPSRIPVQPANCLKRTADGEVKTDFPKGDIPSEIKQSDPLHRNKGLPDSPCIPHGSSTVKDTATITITPSRSLHSEGGSLHQRSTTHSQNSAQILTNDKQHNTADVPTISHSSNTSNICNTNDALNGLQPTFPSSPGLTPAVVLPSPSFSDFVKPGPPASSSSFSAKAIEKPPRKKPGPKPKNKTPAMAHSDSSYVPSDASSSSMERRPRRNRGAPANYYAKVRGFPGYDGDEDKVQMEEDKVISPESNAQQESPTHDIVPNQQLVPIPEPTAPMIRSVYRSSYLQVQQELLLSPVDEFFEEYAPYYSERSRNGYGERCAKENLEKDDPDGRVIHADFDQREMEGLFYVMTGKPFVESDTTLPDLLVQATRKFYPHRDQQKALAQRISNLNTFRKSLLKITNAPSTFLLHHREQGSSWREGDNEAPKRETIRQILSHFHVVLGLPEPPNRVYQVYDILESLRQINKNDFQYLISGMDCFKHRRKRHICAFLSDASNGLISSVPYLLRALSSHAGYPSPDFDRMRPSALLRQRELGERVYRRKTPINHKLQMGKRLELWRRWKGASNDVMVLAWSPDGTRFAAGAAAQSDEHNMIYNRNNNLLLGDLTCNSLKELPDHRVPRPSPNNVTDPNLYMTVSAVQWCGDTLYTASYDNTVKIWDVSTHAGAKCLETLRHDGRVMVMAVSNSGPIATGCDSAPHIKLWTKSAGQHYTPTDLTCNRMKNVAMIPSSLAWGPASAGNLLVAGLAAREDENFRHGHLSVWQMGQSTISPLTVSPNSQNVFDVAWHPTAPIFATGSTVEFASSTMGRTKSTRSLVRVYDPFRPKATWAAHITYECPALDINDVTFCPADSNYITASCTDGVTYVWDYRNPGRILHRLSHGPPISEQDSNVCREQHDTGVRLALWKNNCIDQFYTGGSDGVLKKWNILRAPEDVLVENTAHFDQGIMSGAFSPDFTNLLIGDSCGSIHVVSSAPFSRGDTNMAYEPANEERVSEDEDKLGIKTAEELLLSGKLSRHPVFGVGQGPHYDGPYAAWAREIGTPKEALRYTPLLPEIRATQLDSPFTSRHQLEREGNNQLDARIQITITQNRQRGKNKRKGSEEPAKSYNFSSSSSTSSSPFSSRPTSFSPSMFVSHKHSDITHQYISLLSSDDESGPSSTFPSSSSRIKTEHSTSNLGFPACIDLTGDFSEDNAALHPPPLQQDPSDGALSDDEDSDTLCELWEDDYWWPRNCDVDPNIRWDGA